MGLLQSRLFGGDPALEACAVRDSAHVTQGDQGQHVGKIQTALIMVDGSQIESSELLGKRYGRTTAAAVLAFKSKRQIINYTYQSSPDNIVGKMTIVALDRETAAKEAEGPTPPQARGRTAHCDQLFPGSRPGSGSGSGLELGMSFSDRGRREPPVLSPKAAALGLADAASQRAGKAFVAMTRTIALLERDADLSRSSDWKGLSINFKIHQIASKADRIDRGKELQRRFSVICSILQSASRHFAEDLTNLGDYANAPMGGISSGGQIVFCPKFLYPFDAPHAGTPSGPTFRMGVMIHEAAHFSHADIGHVASELRPPNGSPVTTSNRFLTGHDYASMTPDEALANAYSYAQFCLHVHKGFDYRLTTFAV